ncbi:serine/threonine-protein kinase HipA [Endobacter medicaginis]|uniref:HipA domain-containing protein n=1 Tax=Endobacter medicaginis TaxID=1181271 RepID=A0A839UR05_9PROT|nr:HipA domain-containing protein [Endobacter medicaginis]MBB3172608.1 serine/threonine-protein kinase HipA [Endobacter medicaginis]MCX5476857.1 HipA domain-containing protein [Endobacter medicaginis]NVN29386.1 HipA domain-containing protein [Endobacter medicaginis]
MSAELNLQIHFDGTWHDAATLRINNAKAGHRSSADLDYNIGYWMAHGTVSGAPPIDDRALSVAFPITMEAKQATNWPAFLLDLLPQGDARTRIATQLRIDENSPEVELPLLRLAGGSPIGNIRVQQAWEDAQKLHKGVEIVGLSMDDIARREEPFYDIARRYALLAAGSSGVQGVWPKLLLTTRADGMLAPDSVVPDAEAAAHFIVKTVARKSERHDALILRSEPGYIETARAFGLRCGQPLFCIGDSLMIPRFDREIINGSVVRYGQESIVAAAGIAEFAYYTSHEAYLDVIKRVTTKPEVEVIEYLKRDIIATAMGDPDNHGRNTALTKRRDYVGLTPLFDFAPMRLKYDVYRSTRWACDEKPVPSPSGIRAICAAVARDTKLYPEQVLLALQELLPNLRRIRELAQSCGVPTDELSSVTARDPFVNAEVLVKSIEET